MDDKKCADIVASAFESRMNDIRKMYNAPDKRADIDGDGYLKPLSEYSLGIDYVEANTFTDQPQGYTRYLISWGGPSEEFRVYTVVPRVEFWYMDWFDGAMIKLGRKDANIIRDIVGKAKV